MSENPSPQIRNAGLYRQSVNGINNGFLFGCGCCLFVALIGLASVFGPIIFAGWFVTSVVQEVDNAKSVESVVPVEAFQQGGQTPEPVGQPQEPESGTAEGDAEGTIMFTPPDTREGFELLLEGPPQPRPATPEEIQYMKELEKRELAIQRTIDKASSITAGLSYDAVRQRLGADGYVARRATVNGKRYNSIEWSIGLHTFVAEFTDDVVTATGWK